MTGAEGTPEPGPDAGVDDIRDDIERTRAELGQTVAALSAKMDVPARAKETARCTTNADSGGLGRRRGPGGAAVVATPAAVRSRCTTRLPNAAAQRLTCSAGPP
ncbi:DUF3618 domain-containing protein [Mycobacterium sp. ML4]